MYTMYILYTNVYGDSRYPLNIIMYTNVYYVHIVY